MNGDRRLHYEGVLFTLVVGLVLLWALRVAHGWDELRASIIIFVLGGVGVCLAALQLVMDLRRRHGEAAAGRHPHGCPGAPVSAAVGGTSRSGPGFWDSMPPSGSSGSPRPCRCSCSAYAKTYGGGWLLSSLLAALAWAFVYGVFEHILHVPWPEPFLAGLF